MYRRIPPSDLPSPPTGHVMTPGFYEVKKKGVDSKAKSCNHTTKTIHHQPSIIHPQDPQPRAGACIKYHHAQKTHEGTSYEGPSPESPNPSHQQRNASFQIFFLSVHPKTKKPHNPDNKMGEPNAPKKKKKKKSAPIPQYITRVPPPAHTHTHTHTHTASPRGEREAQQGSSFP